MAINSPIPNPKSSGSDTFSSRLAQENVLNEGSFGAPKAPVAGAEAATATHARRRFKLRLWHYLLAAGVIILLLLLIFWLYRALSKENKTASTTGDYATTAVDLGDIKGTTPGGTSKLLVNGQALISGSLTANSFVGDGADLTNLNATNITSGTLNDARLTPNVALLNANQTFIGVNTFTNTSNFTGQVTLPSTVAIGGQSYNWPQTQAAGSLVNNGSGNLVWDPAGGCVTCFTDGGNSFGSVATIGTNDPFNLILRSGGTDRLTISTAGSSTFSGSVAASSFTGDGSGLSNLNASQIMSGTLSNARLSTSVTTQGNVFNGIDQLVQLNGLGYLPSLNGGNLTSLNASNVTSGTLLDARLSANVAKLDGNQTFIGTNTFSQPITVNSLTPTGAMAIGATNQNLTLRGNGSTSITSTQGGGTTTVNFGGVAVGNVTYQFDASVPAGAYTICTTAGGVCGGGGGGTVSSPGGTTNTLAKFTAGQTIADSTITDTGTYVSISAPQLRVNGAAGGYAIDATGDINAGQYLRVGGNIVCDSTGCATGGGGGYYIQNTTSQQSTANFFIQSAGTTNPTGVVKALGSQTADLIQFQNSSGTPIADVYVGGGINTTDQYYVGGVQITSSNLSDGTNLAKLNANQTFTGDNMFTGNFIDRRTADSLTAFRVQQASSADVLVVDTTNGRVAVGGTAAGYPLDVTGDINSSTGLRVGGTLVCDITGCAASGSSGFYIQNGVAQQTSANFNIQSGNVNDVVATLQGKSGQVADLFQVKDGTAATVFKVSNAGLTTINNGITLTGGNQSITNNTGGLSLVSNGTTIGLNSTSTITSGDGTGLRYAANYAYQPLSLVSRQYVDDAISSVVVGACPTCFLKGGNSFGTSASLGTIDNYVLTLKTANTTRITLGTDGSVAFAGSTASNSYAISSGSGTASGYVSFAGGELTTAASQDSFAFGYQSQVTAGLAAVALGRQTTASNNYAMATGYLSAASGVASFASGRSTASGDYSFATGAGTASGQDSFAGGYNQSPITSSGLGSFAFGRAEGYAITAAGPGSIALGYTQSGATVSNGAGALAGGSNSSTGVGANFSIAYGDGARANGLYSAAFNNSLASNTGAFAINNATASGLFSFAGGSNGSQAYAQDSFAFGYNAKANATVGNYAVAFGRDTVANHNYATAFGNGSQATGDTSTAFGNGTASGTLSFATAGGTASGSYSFAGGYNQSSITASTNGALAFGRTGAFAITAAGEGSVAFGYTDTGANIANGNGSLVGGSNSSTGVGAAHSIAFGDGAQANGAYAAAFNNSVASNTGAFAINAAAASGLLSFAGGSNGSQAYAQDSFAYGYNAKANNVNGIASVAFGRDTTANNNYSFALGYGAASSGEASVALNYSSASGPGATSIGSTLVNASGAYSFAGGYAQSAITATNNGSVALGRSVGFTISATGEGALAIGASRDGAILASGYGSFAGGTNSTANNEFAIAFGNGTQATAAYSAAFNNSTASGVGAFSVGGGTASGTKSFAGGYNQSTITASNNGSFAFGRAVGYTMSATGEGAFAIGASRDGAILASGLGSLAGGTNSTASGEYAFAFGTGTQATGQYSVAFNNSVASNTGAFAINNATASGLFSFAGGENGSLAAGRNSFAFGYTTKANNISGQMSVALGRETTANGSYSFALGYGATASNDGAFAIGATSVASGAYSFAGYNSTASNSGAFAFGDGNTASNQFSTAFGTLNTASGFNSTAFGRRMDVSGNYSFGVSLNDTALSVTDANSFVINAGYVGINTASPSSYTSAFSLVGNGYTYGSTVASTGIASRVRAGDNSSGTLIQFERADATVVGSITHNGSNTSYNTSSDERLKHDITDTSLSLDTVLQLQVHDFVYNNDSSNTVTTGFIAQELQKLYPEAVSVMDPATGYLGVDYGKLTPLLAKGIQDLNTKVDNLQSQTDQLKTALDAIQTNSSGTATSVDILKTLADAQVITLNGDLIVGGNVVVAGRTEISAQNKAQITIPAGQTSIVVALPSSFAAKPNVSITPQDFVDGQYRVTNVTKTSFTLELQKAQTTDTSYFWQAL